MSSRPSSRGSTPAVSLRASRLGVAHQCRRPAPSRIRPPHPSLFLLLPFFSYLSRIRLSDSFSIFSRPFFSLVRQGEGTRICAGSSFHGLPVTDTYIFRAAPLSFPGSFRWSRTTVLVNLRLARSRFSGEVVVQYLGQVMRKKNVVVGVELLSRSLLRPFAEEMRWKPTASADTWVS